MLSRIGFILMGLMAMVGGLLTALYGGFYRGYPLPRAGGVLEILFGVLCLIYGIRKKGR